MAEINFGPTQSYDLWEMILAHRTEDSILFGDLEIKRKHINEIYDIILTNRARTKGTVLTIQTDDAGAIQNIDSQAVRIAPKPIITPKITQCSQCKRQYENELDKCPKCGKGNPRLGR